MVEGPVIEISKIDVFTTRAKVQISSPRFIQRVLADARMTQPSLWEGVYSLVHHLDYPFAGMKGMAIGINLMSNIPPWSGSDYHFTDADIVEYRKRFVGDMDMPNQVVKGLVTIDELDAMISSLPARGRRLSDLADHYAKPASMADEDMANSFNSGLNWILYMYVQKHRDLEEVAQFGKGDRTKLS